MSSPGAIQIAAPRVLARWVADDTPLKRLLTTRGWMVRAYFECRYLTPDPWRLATSPYERERAARTLALLAGRRYRCALELGCGEGFFTARLLEVCDRAVAADFAALALRRARSRFAAEPRVEVRRFDVLRDDPGARFDLVVCAELFYYMNGVQFEAAAPKVAGWVAPGGDLCLVHGTSVHDPAGEAPFLRPRAGADQANGLRAGGGTGAAQIHARFCRIPGFALVRDEALPRYRLTLLRREETHG